MPVYGISNHLARNHALFRCGKDFLFDVGDVAAPSYWNFVALSLARTLRTARTDYASRFLQGLLNPDNAENIGHFANRLGCCAIYLRMAFFPQAVFCDAIHNLHFVHSV